MKVQQVISARASVPDSGEWEVAGDARQTTSFHTTYWDTRDLRLARWGCAVRQRDGGSWVVTLASEVEDGVLAERRVTVESDTSGPPTAATGLLRAYTFGADLQPVARVRTDRRTSMAGHGAKRGVRLDHDILTRLDTAGRTLNQARRVIASGNEDRSLLVKALQSEVKGAVVDPNLAIAAVLAPRAQVRWRSEELPHNADTERVVRAALRDFTARLVRNHPLLLAGDDDALRQIRVAARRLRSALQTFAPVLDQAFADRHRELLRAFAHRAGEARDLSVLAERLQQTASGVEADTLAPLIAELQESATSAQQRVLSEIAGPAHERFLRILVAAADSPQMLPESSGEPALRTLRPLVKHRWRRLRRGVRDLGDNPQDEQLHQIRILTKRCRYATLALVPVAGKRASATALELAGLQDILGEHHDACVMADWLQAHGTGPAGFLAGRLYERERAVADRARREWFDGWEALSPGKMWKWL